MDHDTAPEEAAVCKPNLTASPEPPTILLGWHLSGRRRMEVGSEAGKLSGHDVKRVLLHVLQMTAATALTVAAEQAGSLDLGPWKPFVAVGLTAAIDLVRRWQTSTKVIVEGGQK